MTKQQRRLEERGEEGASATWSIVWEGKETKTAMAVQEQEQGMQKSRGRARSEETKMERKLRWRYWKLCETVWRGGVETRERKQEARTQKSESGEWERN